MYEESARLSERQGEEERQRNPNPANCLDKVSTLSYSNQINIVDKHAIVEYP
jgi:hypothetical protein